MLNSLPLFCALRLLVITTTLGAVPVAASARDLVIHAGRLIDGVSNDVRENR